MPLFENDGRWFSVTLVAVYIALTVSGILLTKSGLHGIGSSSGEVRALLSRPHLLLGVAAYGGSFLLWFIVLARFDLSFIVPLCIGLIQVLILTAAVMLHGESPSRLQLVGASMVIAGVILMTVGRGASG